MVADPRFLVYLGQFTVPRNIRIYQQFFKILRSITTAVD